METIVKPELKNDSVTEKSLAHTYLLSEEVIGWNIRRIRLMSLKDELFF